MYTKAQEQLSTQTNAEKVNKEESTSLIDYYPIDNTPFTEVVTPESKHIVMGNYRITKESIGNEDAKDWLNKHQWDVTMTCILILQDIAKKEVMK